jgi:mannose-1-phosphate guanylyltransferase
MVEETMGRILEVVPSDRILVVTSDSLVKTMLEVAPTVAKANIVAEPVGRNTAPAIAAAACLLDAKDSRASMAVLPSDHVIRDRKTFARDLDLAFEVAEKDNWLITFGIKPDRGETGYGYIERGSTIDESLPSTVYKVKTFTEKPDEETAARMVKQGTYYWNSGMFVWSVKSILNAIEEHLPDLFKETRALRKAARSHNLAAGLRRFYERASSISIDYGVLEKASNCLVIEAGYDWDDVGSWLSWQRLFSSELDDQGNLVRGDAIAVDTSGCSLVSEEGLIATLGVENVVVVRVSDATLVVSKEKVQHVRKLVEELKKDERLGKYIGPVSGKGARK